METYEIRRFRFNKGSRKIMGGLSLEEAQEHCSKESTHGKDWFDGYIKE